MAHYVIEKLFLAEPPPPNEHGRRQTICLPDCPGDVHTWTQLIHWIATDPEAIASTQTAILALFGAFQSPKKPQ